MKRVKHFPLILLSAAIVLLASCKKVDVNFGSQYLDNNQTGIVRLDTVKPLLSTVFVDSFVTAASGAALLGNYTDAYMGKVSASAYFELGPPSGVTINQNDQFDSLILVIKPNKTYYGDTTAPVPLSVYQLSENIVLRGNATNLYNTSSFARQSTPLGQASFVVRPNATDTVSIRLSNTLGNSLFTMLRNNDVNIQNSTNFINYFKGLYLSTGNGAKMVFGIKDTIEMRVCYHVVPSTTLDTRTAVFTLVNNTHQFNSISIDRSGTALGNAGFGRTNRQVFSTATGNMAFSQYITGSMAKISFPSLRDLRLLPNFSRILSAQLIVRPVKGSYTSGYDSLPAQMRLAATDINNQIGGNLTITINGTQVTQTGNLVIDELANTTNYSFDVTAYLQNLITIGDESARYNNGLLLLPPPPQYTTTFNRLVMNDATLKQNQLQLIIYYLAIQ